MSDLVAGTDGLLRCRWAMSTPDYIAYHDDEWGVPIRTDVALYERLTLESFQSGLSWLTVLRKRENFRSAFAGFDPERIAGFGEKDITRLLADAGIIRHRGKIESAINNARALVSAWEQVGATFLVDSLALNAPSDASLVSQGYARPPRHDPAARPDQGVQGAGEAPQEPRIRLPGPDHALRRPAGHRLRE